MKSELEYSFRDAEMMLVFWEHIYNGYETDEAWTEYWDATSIIEMRHTCIELGAWAAKVFWLLPVHVRAQIHGFDDEFPTKMLGHVTWNKENHTYDYPPAEDVATAWLVKYELTGDGSGD